MRRARSVIALLLFPACLALTSRADTPRITDPEALARIQAKVRDLEHPPGQPGEAQRYFDLQRQAHDGKSTPVADRYLQAVEAMRDMPRYSTRQARRLPSLRTTEALDDTAKDGALGTWSELGPGNVGGRMRALVIDPTRPATLFAAGVSGGIWKSTNGGASWAPLSDLKVNIAVNSLVMDPTDPRVLYAGTGEGYLREIERGTALPLRGNGIFKSTDGRTFTRLPSTANSNFHWVNDLVISPNDNRRIYAATRTGVWRSANGGQGWQRILAPATRGGCLDLVIRSDRATDVLFAACGTFGQATVFRNQAAEGDGGWEAVLSEAGMGRTTLALAPSNQDRIYALAASIVPGPGGHFDGGLHAFFRSDSGGAAGSWSARVRNSDAVKLHTLLLSNPIVAHLEECGAGGTNRYSTLGWHANVVAVDPVDPDIVWAGGVDLFRSNDGGDNWGLTTYWWNSPPSAHADHHRIVFHPDYDGAGNQTLYLANDGGIWQSTNARAPAATGTAGVCDPNRGAVRWTSRNNSLGVTQFYHGAPFPDGRQFFGGTQDNGTITGSNALGLNGWRRLFGGDGGYVAVDPTDTSILYVETQGVNLQRSTDGGNTFVDAVDGITDTAAEALFIVPFVIDPNDPRRLWLGTRRLWRSEDQARNWTAASTAFDASGKVSAIAVAPGDPGHVLAGLSTGAIHRNRGALTTGGSSSWAASRPRDGYVSWLAFDPRDPDVAYATYAGFGGQHVWRSADGGATWEPLPGTGAGRLPDIPVHAITIDPDDSTRLYLGTDLGVFVSVDGGATWMVENTGFANAVTESLTITGGGAQPQVFAFTHGRGAWKVPLTVEPPGVLELNAGSVDVFEDAGQALLTVRRSGGSGGAVSVSYATADGTATAGGDYAATSGTLTWAAGDASDKTIAVPILDDQAIEGPETFTVALTGPTGGAELGGQTSATVRIADNDVEPGDCVAGPTALCLSGGRFRVEIEWQDFEGGRGTGRVVEGTPSDDSGLFWFFAADNWELLFKMVDGCGFNQRFWVFFAATTNVGYTLTVTDTERGQLRSYSNPLGNAAAAVTDVDAFATCP